MRVATPFVVLACVVAIGANVATAEQPSGVPTGTASIFGRVVEVVSNRPLEHAILTLTSAKARTALTAITDAEGRYSFEHIAAGNYRLTAFLEGYGIVSYWSLPVGTRAEPVLQVADAQAMRGIDFALQPAGIITGHIGSTDGRPLKNVDVSAIPTRDDSSSTIIEATRTRTDERGAYTIRNVPEGSYRVLAAWADPEMLKAGAGSALRVTYFPSTDKIDDAMPIRVHAGETLANINITLTSSDYLRFTGHVLRGNSEGRIEALVLLGAWSIRTIPIADDGAFAVTHLKPGRYTFWARATTPDGFEAAVVTLDLRSDMTGLTLPLLPTGALKGHVMRDDGGALPVGGLQVAAIQADQGQAIDPLERDRADVDAEGRFHVVGLFGERVLRIMGLGPQWHVDRIMHGKTSVERLTIAPGQETTDLTVVVKRQP
jgi:hypothetical protein